MEERIIGIDNFLKYKIIKINEEYSIYIVIEWNKAYFEEVGEGIFKIKNNIYDKSYNYALNTIKPYIKKNKDIADLEKTIYLLFQDIKFIIPRVEINKKYYFINNNFIISTKTETRSNEDDLLYFSYNYFLTYNEAVNCAIELRKYLKKIREE